MALKIKVILVCKLGWCTVFLWVFCFDYCNNIELLLWVFSKMLFKTLGNLDIWRYLVIQIPRT